MPRHQFTINQVNPEILQKRLLAQSASESHFSLLVSNGHTGPYSQYAWLCGWGLTRFLSTRKNSLSALKAFHEKEKDWLLGHLNFNLKNELENLESQHADPFEYANLAFFVPTTVVYEKGGTLHCESYQYQKEEDLIAALPENWEPTAQALPQFQQTLSQEEYLQKIATLKAELQYGSIYEINFCMELAAQGALEAPGLFWKLNQRHQAPFTGFYQCQENQLLCFSPERYLQKKGTLLTSQPIKGTAKRGKSEAEDAALQKSLLDSEKERAENVMIVDLVRNDLSRTAQPASVRVPELFGLYSYQAVHQMVSTVQSDLAPQFHFTDALATSFPMGSMTGAPKISALRLIDQHENFNRSLYSGSIGYITPQGDFDFNVVIRSILHHRQKQLSSVRVGSAITIHCEAQQEYEECLLKAERLISLT